MNKHITKPYISFLSIAVVVSLSSCGGKKEEQKAQQAPPAVQATVQQVKDTIAIYYDEYPATVTALNQIDLRSQVSGNITGIFFKDGDKVRKGQLLYSIDEQLYQANLQQAIANLKVQEANVNRAQKDADRYHTLDKADAAKANIQALQTNVRYTRVYAPFDGTIGISQVKVGSPVSAGTTVLNTISTDDPLAADISIDQKQIFRFSNLLQKQDSLKRNNDSTFTLAFAEDVYPIPGNISLIDRAVDPQTGSIRMRLVFPNPKSLLKAGMTGTIRVKNNANQQSLVVPYKSVTEQLGEFFVYVVGDSNKVSQRKVALGPQVGPNVIIRDGLKANETVVVQGVQNLREGAVITTAPPQAQQQAQPAKK